MTTAIGKLSVHRTIGALKARFRENSPAGGDGAYLPCGVGWYRKKFELEEDISDKRVFLEFDGVYQSCGIWLNGKPAGEHIYGYTGFSVDITEKLISGGNILAVRVDNSKQPSSRWYSGSGIYRHVWLDVKNNVRIARHGVYITCPQADIDSATLEIQTDIENFASDTSLTVKSELFDDKGVLCAAEECGVGIAAIASCVNRLDIEAPRLWSDEEPYLYKAVVTVTDAGEVKDRREITYGIRSAEFDCDRGSC
jgi:beta-galactosidase